MMSHRSSSRGLARGASIIYFTFMTSFTSSSLPIHAHSSTIIHLLQHHETLIVVGEPGCGKSTQLPQIISDAGWNKLGAVAITQPRQVAVTSLAEKLASLRRSRLGDEIGFSIRFNSMISTTSKIIVMTDGWLLQEIAADPMLSKFSVVILDEVHERSAQMDILLALLRKIQRRRLKDPLKIVLSSATLDPTPLQAFFSSQSTPTAILPIKTRTYPVQVRHLASPASDLIAAITSTVLAIHLSSPLPGDVLVFLPGVSEIDSALSALKSQVAALPPSDPPPPSIRALPLHATLTSERQEKALSPPPENVRKIIYSTSIAESALTVPGITHVIDSGWTRLTAQTSLITVPVSKDQAIQRAGRAGRTGPGTVYRMYTSSWASSSPSHPQSHPPAIQREALAPILLILASLGISAPAALPMPSPLPIKPLAKASLLLNALGALDTEGSLTPAGELMAQLPLSPVLSAILVKALPSPSITYAIISIVAMASAVSSAGALWTTPSSTPSNEAGIAGHTVLEGDPLTWYNIFTAFNDLKPQKRARWCSKLAVSLPTLNAALRIRSILAAHLARAHSPLPSQPPPSPTDKEIMQAIAAGAFVNVAIHIQDGTYKDVESGANVFIHPSSVLFAHPPPLICYLQLLTTTKPYMQGIAAIHSQWLFDANPGYFTTTAEQAIKPSSSKPMLTTPSSSSSSFKSSSSLPRQPPRASVVKGLAASLFKGSDSSSSSSSDSD